jgi:hypothetical protein
MKLDILKLDIYKDKNNTIFKSIFLGFDFNREIRHRDLIKNNKKIKIYTWDITNEINDHLIGFIRMYKDSYKNGLQTIYQNKLYNSIFSKGHNRLISLMYFSLGYLYLPEYNILEKIDWWDTLNKKQKHFLMAVFIIGNQVFGDANHRTAGFIIYLGSNNISKKNQHILTDSIESIIRNFLHIAYPENSSDRYIEIWMNNMKSCYKMFEKYL